MPSWMQGQNGEWWLVGAGVGFVLLAVVIGGGAALLSEASAERWQEARGLEVTEEAAQRARMTTAEAMMEGEGKARAAKEERDRERKEKAAEKLWLGKEERR